MLKILVIDEETAVRRLYRHDLERDGYQVLTTGSSREGLDMLERASPDLVVIDAHTRDMDGVEAISRLVSRCPRIPVVLSWTPTCPQDGVIGHAADAYIPKSQDTAALRRQIRKLLAPDAA